MAVPKGESDYAFQLLPWVLSPLSALRIHIATPKQLKAGALGNSWTGYPLGTESNMTPHFSLLRQGTQHQICQTLGLELLRPVFHFLTIACQLP